MLIKILDAHIHDLGMLTGYCECWPFKKLIKVGLCGIEGKINSTPSKYLFILWKNG